MARFGGGEASAATFDAVVNCAGLGAQAIARAVSDYPRARVPRLVLAKAITSPMADYNVDPARADVFYGRIRSYWPGPPDSSLVPDYSGIQPKLSGIGEPQADCLIDRPVEHGQRGLVQMFGIESPG